jgi:hypothetical protein
VASAFASTDSIRTVPEFMDYYTDGYHDKLDKTHNETCKAASVEVAEFIQEQQITTVSELVHKFPQHQRIMFSILDYLRIDGKVYWDEWRPLPTLIHAGDRRISEETYKYDWSTARLRDWQHRVQDTGVV